MRRSVLVMALVALLATAPGARAEDLGKRPAAAGDGYLALSLGLYMSQNVILTVTNDKGDKLTFEDASGIYSKHDAVYMGPKGTLPSEILAKGRMPTRTNREYRLFMRAFPLPPGSYKVSNIKMTGGTDITLDMATYIMDAKSDIRFDIVPGQTTYIGRMEWAPIYHKAFLGIPLFTGWHYEITDASEQDMAVLIGKVPALPPAKSQLVPTAGMKPWIN